MQFGFSYIGLAFLSGLFVPNLIWLWYKPVGYDRCTRQENKALVLCEHLGQIAVTALVLSCGTLQFNSISWWSLFLAAAVLLMILYELYWVRYFKSKQTMQDFYAPFCGIPVPGATLPVFAFFLLSLYSKSLPLIGAVILLGIGHIGVHIGHARNCNNKGEHAMQFIIATQNQHKLAEMQRMLQPLGITVCTAELPPVAETGTTFAENALLKARSACDYTGQPAIADDSGLIVDALNGAPGVYSARYAGPNATDEQNNAKLLAALQNVPAPHAARFMCAVCCVFPNGDRITAQGSCEGEIALAPAGSGGFGYDPLFLVGQRSFAQLTDAEKDQLSHRGKALAQFYEQLQTYLNTNKGANHANK